MRLPKYFVYIKALGKLNPQLWFDDLTTGENKFSHGAVNPDGPLVFFHKLEDHEKELTLDQLHNKYKEQMNEKIIGTVNVAAS